VAVIDPPQELRVGRPGSEHGRANVSYRVIERANRGVQRFDNVGTDAWFMQDRRQRERGFVEVPNHSVIQLRERRGNTGNRHGLSVVSRVIPTSRDKRRARPDSLTFERFALFHRE
jgi:hypothetical protein